MLATAAGPALTKRIEKNEDKLFTFLDYTLEQQQCRARRARFYTPAERNGYEHAKGHTRVRHADEHSADVTLPLDQLFRIPEIG